jgi:hypothetical protein
MTGFSDRAYRSGNPQTRGKWLTRTRKAGSRIVRINMSWAAVAGPNPPASPRNPGSPTYNFGTYDAAVTDAAAHGLKILMTITGAPAWAEGPHRPARAPQGTWKPRANAYGDFAHAVAERYSGSFGGLPRVGYLQAWNEPNLFVYLNPQFRHKRATSPSIYRRMLNSFYAGVHSASGHAKVVTGGTAPYGDPPGGQRVRPLAFWRKVLCLKRNLHRGRCKHKAHLDVLAHNPIDTNGGPHTHARRHDDVATPDFHRIVKTLRAAEHHHTVRPKGHRPAWATELWWESNPPDHAEGVSLKKHARWLGTALRLLRKQGARVVINLQLRDGKYTHANRFDTTASGIFFHHGKRKPAFHTWRAASG